jgi:hypothetical protein
MVARFGFNTEDTEKSHRVLRGLVEKKKRNSRWQEKGRFLCRSLRLFVPSGSRISEFDTESDDLCALFAVKLFARHEWFVAAPPCCVFVRSYE